MKRIIAAIVFCVIAGTLAVLITASTALRSRSPDIAISLWPGNAEARGHLASKHLIAQRMTAARPLARQAVRAAPGDAVSLRVLGISEELAGFPARGARIMQLAIRASRRDLLTNLWFVEHHVARNDIVGAIRHYDFALKSSAESEQVLFPVLVPAMADPGISRAVRDKLMLRPVWLTSFLQYAFASGAADKQLIPIVLSLAKQQAGLPLDLQRQFAQRLAERGDLEGLAHLARGLDRPIINGPAMLDEIGPLPPVDWRLLSGAGLSTFPNPAGGFGFVVAGQNVTLADRILHLSPGRYMIAFQTKFTSSERASVRAALVCASDNRSVVMNGDLLRIIIPAQGCLYQRLSFSIESASISDGNEISGLIHNIKIKHN